MEDLVQPSCACGRKEDLLLCSDCFLQDVSCRKCCLDHHKYLPFHRIKQWNGRFFASSSLYGQGHIIYLGHQGKPCPSNNNVTTETTGKDSFVDSANLLGEDANLMVEEEVEGDRKQWVTQEVPESILVMVHMTGVFQHHVRWCTCNGCAKHAAASIMFVSS